MELAQDRIQVVVDVGVIEFDIVDRQSTRTVVDELGALVEKGGVVFIGLDDEVFRPPEAGGYTEIGGHAADQEPRFQARVLQYPGQQAAGGGLPVSARDRQDPAIPEHVFRQPLGAGTERQAGVQQGLHHLSAPAHDVAHHHAIDLVVEMLRVVPLPHGDAKIVEQIAHRWISVLIGPRDPVARRLCQRGDAAHESAADSKDVNAHGPTA